MVLYAYNPGLRGWEQENHKFKVTFNYTKSQGQLRLQKNLSQKANKKQPNGGKKSTDTVDGEVSNTDENFQYHGQK